MHHLIFIFKLAIRNLKLNYKRNLAALTSIVAGFMSVNLFEGYIQNTQNLFNSNYEQRFMYGDLMVYHKKSFIDSTTFNGVDYITKEHQDKIIGHFKSLPEVEVLIRRLSFRGIITNGDLSAPFVGDALDVKEGEAMRAPLWKWNTSYGHPLQEGSGSIVLGEELGRLLKCSGKSGQDFLDPKGGYIPKYRELDCERTQLQLQTTTDSGQMNAIFVDAGGLSNALFRDIDSRYIQVPLSRAQQLLDTEGISLITLRLKKDVEKAPFVSKIENFFKSHQLPLRISSWKENAFGNIYQQSMSFLNVLRGFFLIVILLIVMFSIMATQTRLIFERIKETATLRSIGFSPRLITHIFIAEATLMALLGSLIGALFSVLVSFSIKQIGIFYMIGILSEKVPFSIGTNVSNFLAGTLALIGLTIIACYIPLKRALALSISEAFTHS